MSNILIVPDSGSIYFTTGSAGNSAIPNLSSGVAFKFDNSAGVNITSYATGVSDNDRFSIDGYNGRLFNVSDNLTGIIFSVNDGAGLPIIEVDSGAVDKVTMGTYGTNTFVIDGNKVGIGTGVPAAKLDIFDNVLAGSAGLAGSVLNLNQTWNTTGTPSAIKLNVTDTASNAASKLLDLQIGTVSKFSVDKAGGIKISDATTVGGSDQKYLTFNTVWGEVIFTNWGGQLWILGQGLTTFSVNSPAYFTTHIGLGGNKDTADVKLWKDTSNILAQRNGVNAQAFRLYNTYTTSTNFERLNLKWDTNVLKIGTEKGTEGGVARAMEFQTDGIARLILRTDGYVDIGATPLITESNDVDGVNGNRFKVIGNLAFGGGGLMIRSSTINSSSRLVVACPNNAQATSAYLFGIDGLQLNKGLIYTNSDQSISLVNGSGGNNDTYTRILNITSAGNVGIGTTTPTEKLHVLGNIRNVGNLSIYNSDIVTTLDRLTVDGSQGRLFTVTDSLVGSLMSVNDIAGLPILEVFDDDKIVMGEYASNALTVLGKNVGIGTGSPTAKLDILDTVLAGSGSLAGSALNIAQTWNTSGTPTAIKLNIIDTASNAVSNLIDLQVGAVSMFKVNKNGNVSLNALDKPVGSLLINSTSVGGATIYGNTRIQAGSLNFNANLYLHSDDANIFAQRNGVNPQAFRLYNTYTSSTNFERLNLRWDTNVVKIGTGKGSAGGLARDLSFETDATTRMTIAASGDISFSNPTQVRTALGFVELTPSAYADLVASGIANPDTIYIVQE